MSGRVNELLVDRVNKRQGNMVSGQVNEWTSEPVACYKEKLVHLLLCLSIILSFLASNSLTCLLAFPHPEKTLHSLKQITLKSIQKTQFKSDSTTNRKSNSYKAVKQKVLYWTSKGR